LTCRLTAKSCYGQHKRSVNNLPGFRNEQSSKAHTPHREGLPPNTGFQPSAPAGAPKIVRILLNAFPV
jgi:hypothetical protein